MSSKSISAEVISQKIYIIRGQKVMLASDLAKLYGVSVKRLNEQVKRSKKRFPPDFMFQLTRQESDVVGAQAEASSKNFSRSQIATLKRGENIKYQPYAFTQEGVAMLSGVLNSERAIAVNIAIMRAFVKLREAFIFHKELAAKLKELECKIEGHDASIHTIFDVIRRLMREEEKPKKKIGFHS